MNLQSTDFELFELPEQFGQDRAAIDARWKALQREAHPDKFAAQGAAAQRLAMQWSVRINEAYQRLKDPQKRAAYLCELAGAAVQAHDNTAMPGDFLMQQMTWREALDDAGNAAEVEALSSEVTAQRRERLARVGELLDGPTAGTDATAQAALAAQEVRALMFIDRLLEEVDTRLQRYEDEEGA